MRIGVVLAVLMQSFLAPIASAITTDVTLLSQDFASYNGVDANAPAGWTFTNIGHYTTESSSGVAPNALQFNSSTSVATATYTLAANQTSKTFSFWMKGNGTGTSGSMLTVNESSNGTSWTPAATYTGTDIPSAGATIVANLLPTTTNVQFVYTKVTGNVAIDDAVITGQEVDEAPTKPDASPPAGTYNTAQSVTLSTTDDSGIATIRYTTDGSTTPDQTSQLYTDAITVGTSMTIKAIAYDAMGNASEIATFPYVIDTVAPIIQNVQYSNNGAPTNNDVTVRITTSEPVDRPDGWTRIDDVTFTKQYSANTPDTVSVRDVAGNVSEVSTIDVRGIDKTQPTISINGTSDENGIYTSTVTYATSDDVAVSTVTINGVAAPSSDSITSSGTYTIRVIDTAGNPAEITITVAIPVVQPTLPVQPSLTLEPLSPRSLVSTPNIETSEVATSSSPKTTVRTDTVQASSPDVIDAPGKDVALAPSEEGWKLWGIAWYWYGAVAGLMGSGWWLFGRKYFTAGSDEF